MKTETVIIIGAAVLIFGGPALKALAGGRVMIQPVLEPEAVLDPLGGPTRVQAPTAIPIATVEPVDAFSEFVVHGPDVSTTDLVEAGTTAAKWYVPFVLNPIGWTIDGVLSLF